MTSLASQFPLTPQALEDLVQALPAQLRADLQWAPRKLAGILAPLLTEPLSPALVSGCALRVWQEVSQPLTGILNHLPGTDPEQLLVKLRAELEREAARISQWPISAEGRRSAQRALATVFYQGALGLVALAQGHVPPLEVPALRQALASEIPEAIRRGEALFQAQVLLSATLHGGNTTGAPVARLEALAELADASALQVATALHRLNPRDIPMGWYFDGPAAASCREIALWAEAAPLRARRLALLLESWSAEEERESGEADREWTQVREGLEANRAPARPLFG